VEKSPQQSSQKNQGPSGNPHLALQADSGDGLAFDGQAGLDPAQGPPFHKDARPRPGLFEFSDGLPGSRPRPAEDVERGGRRKLLRQPARIQGVKRLQDRARNMDLGVFARGADIQEMEAFAGGELPVEVMRRD